jgi:hypothetical protein
VFDPLVYGWVQFKVGLNIVEDTIVGGSTGLGLSGGQVHVYYARCTCTKQFSISQLFSPCYRNGVLPWLFSFSACLECYSLMNQLRVWTLHPQWNFYSIFSVLLVVEGWWCLLFISHVWKSFICLIGFCYCVKER